MVALHFGDMHTVFAATEPSVLSGCSGHSHLLERVSAPALSASAFGHASSQMRDCSSASLESSTSSRDSVGRSPVRSSMMMIPNAKESVRALTWPLQRGRGMG